MVTHALPAATDQRSVSRDTDKRHSRRSPYKGLVPYTEEDEDYFFGRDADCEIIAANLRTARLTLLYGQSGVGKSSVLRAGVTPRLRALSGENLKKRGTPRLAVAVFREWQHAQGQGSASTLSQLVSCIHDAVQQALGGLELAPEDEDSTLTQCLQHWSFLVDGPILIILDQFDEYFLYNPDKDEPGTKGTFAAAFVEAVASAAVRANFLISIREDALAKLDCFKGHIPFLFDNYLRIEHLDREAAEQAIRKPLEYFNKNERANLRPIEIEDALVGAILKQISEGSLALSGSASSAVPLPPREPPRARQLEAPYLQLTLVRLWDEETYPRPTRFGFTRGVEPLDPPVLRLATLERLGGVDRIVRMHLDQIMRGLPRRQRAVAARIFRFLVTASGTKIAWSLADLEDQTHLPFFKVAPVVNALAGEARILRPLDTFTSSSPPAKKRRSWIGHASDFIWLLLLTVSIVPITRRVWRLWEKRLWKQPWQELPSPQSRYEVFHDRLGEAIRDWRLRYERGRRATKWFKMVAIPIFGVCSFGPLWAGMDLRTGWIADLLGLVVLVAILVGV
jgi:hypothetical protein